MANKVVPIKRAASWDAVREGYSRMQQMGYQSVEQAARVGQMLIELKGKTEHGDWAANLTRALSLKTQSAANMAGSRLMRLAEHWSKLAKHKPESVSAALELIPKKKRAVVEDDPDTDVVTEPDPPDEPEKPPTEEDYSNDFWVRVSSAGEYGKRGFKGKKVAKDMIVEARAVAAIWNELAQQLEKRL